MTRLGACGVLAASVISLHGVFAQQPVFRGRGDAVRVFVTVTDRDGRLVTSLTRGDFEVRDDRKPQPLAQFDNSPQPIKLVVMLDVSGSMAGNLPLLRAASEQLFARLRPDDEVRLGSFGEQVTISPSFTHDPGGLLAALPDTIAPDAPTPLWRVDFRHRASSQAEVIDRARNEDVMVCAVAMHSRPRRPPGGAIGPGSLQAALLADLPDPGLARVAGETQHGFHCRNAVRAVPINRQ